MRKQIAAANWKMNLTYQQAEQLLDGILQEKVAPGPDQQVLFAVPFPYLVLAKSEVDEEQGYAIAAQNCSDKVNGAYTGETSVEMLQSVGIRYCVLGHSERREYFSESNELLARKIDLCLEYGIQPLFCCGEALQVRESGQEAAYVQKQLEDSLFHLDDEQIRSVIIAYEPIWAIGTGKTASAQQAQDMHAHIRSVLAQKWGKDTADSISILYGGSVKANNAAELFTCPDVDGGLVGGASLVAQDFVEIIKALKS
ncbi:MAG: triose-phosphate isomerase [Chitinophagaceae bacterium]|nr:MAG: triose-phosphate isomerase [Chitinophagaceae bacterium]